MSVIVPCYNEEAVLRYCHSRLTRVLESNYGNEFEILYIDDGSTDHSVEILRSLHRDSLRRGSLCSRGISATRRR